MEGKTVALALGMLLTGTLNTVATKFQDLVVVGHDSKGEPRYFQHPVVQSAMMFLGELLCLIPYTVSFLAQRWAEGPDTAHGGGIRERRRSAHSIQALLAFSIPAACDACGTTLLNIGLFFTYASAFQMLRGSLVFFCGIFTIIILQRRLHVHHWLGMTLIVAGAALVGLASLITDEWAALTMQSAPHGVGHGSGSMTAAAAAAGVVVMQGEGASQQYYQQQHYQQHYQQQHSHQQYSHQQYSQQQYYDPVDTTLVAGSLAGSIAGLVANSSLLYNATSTTWPAGASHPAAYLPRHLLYMGRRGLKAASLLFNHTVPTAVLQNPMQPHPLTQHPPLTTTTTTSSTIASITSWLAASSSTAPAPLLGNLLVVAAQIAAAAQFIIEEKFLTQYRVPALLAVGLEGFWGLLICTTIGPWLARVHIHGRPFDNFAAAMHEISISPMLLWSTIASIVSIAFFNSFGVKVTKRLSGAARAAIDACRTLFIWVIALGLGWEPLSPPLRIALQVLGFLVLLSGTSLYNELLRSCLPSPVLVSDETASLLGQGVVRGEGGVGGDGGQQQGGSAAYAVRGRPYKEEYSMARSMRVLPQALSPHSLSSVRFSRVFGPLTRAESAAGTNGGLAHSPDDGGSLSTHVSWLTRATAGGDESAHGGVFFSEDSGALEAPLLQSEDTPPPSRNSQRS